MPKIFLFTGYDADQGQNIVGHRPATLEAIGRFGATPLGESLDDLDDSFLDGNGQLADPLLDQLDPHNQFHRLDIFRILAVYRHAFSRMSRELNPIIDGRPGYTNADVEMLRQAQYRFLDRADEFEKWLKPGLED